MGATLIPSMSRRNFSFFLALALCVSFALAADAGIWKMAPPPPISWERDRVADLTARRQALMQQIGDKGILILYAAEPRNYAGDVNWQYRQENDFFYLTSIQIGRASCRERV